MPLNIPSKLPAVEILKSENIFVMDSQRASAQDIRPLRIIILNLMPLKITTETDLIRLLSNTPLQLEIDFLKISGHVSKNTPVEHMRAFYKEFSEICDRRYDGMIITGAPVEQMALGRSLFYIRLGSDTCYVDHVYLLGGAGWVVSLLRYSQISVGEKTFWRFSSSDFRSGKNGPVVSWVRR